MNASQNPAAIEAAKTESQAQAVREFHLFVAIERMREGASADWLLGYLEAIAEPGEDVEKLKRWVLLRYAAETAA